MSIETGMYLYPWEIDDFSSFEKGYHNTGCNAVAPALSYHLGDALSARTGHFTQINEAALSFTPNESLYGRIKPKVFAETAKAGTVKTLREWCLKTGRKFSAWTVLLNNPSQGAMYPELCMENIFGDRYTHSLCSSKPDVRKYTVALLADICEQFGPDSVMLESVGPRPAGAGSLGVIANVRITAAVRWLWSLCFCPACMSRASQLFPALEPPKLREDLKRLCAKLLNSEVNIAGNEDALTAMIMTETPGLSQYQYARQLLQAEYIAGLSRQLHAAKTEMWVVPSALPFDINKVYIEGMSFAACAGIPDKWLPLVYGADETYTLVKNTIRLFDSQTPAGMAATLLRYPDKNSFHGAILSARADGCDTFYFYNYSLASAERLAWVAELNKELQA